MGFLPMYYRSGHPLSSEKSHVYIWSYLFKRADCKSRCVLFSRSDWLTNLLLKILKYLSKLRISENMLEEFWNFLINPIYFLYYGVRRHYDS